MPIDAVTGDALASDAVVVDAGIDAVTSSMGVVEPTKLPLLPSTDTDRGEETQLFAADADGAKLTVALWPPTTPMLALAQSKPITGQLLAPSRLAAARAVATAAGIVPITIAAKKKSLEVDLQFAHAPQHDLFRLLGDVLRINIVVGPAPLPDLLIAAKHVSATDVLASIAELDNLDVVTSGNTTYLLPHGTKLPKLGDGRQQVSVNVYKGNLQQAVAALQAVVPTKAASCDHSTFSLHVRRVTLAEAVRALEVASGVPTDPTAKCPIDAATAVDADAKLVATAVVGDKAAAVVAGPGSEALVKRSKDITVIEAGVTVNGTTFQPEMPALAMPPDALDYQAWLRNLVRADAVYREGSRWFARIVMIDGDFTITDERDNNYSLPLELKRDPPQIGPTGIDLVNPDRSTKTHIPLAMKP